MSEGVRVDVSGVRRLFDALSPDQLVPATRQAFRRSASIVRRAVQNEFRAEFPGSELYKGVHLGVYRTGKGAVVHINAVWFRYSKKHPLYKSFILPILEQGNYRTSPRRTRRGYNRGDMAPRHFFRRGVDASAGEAQASLENNITAAIMMAAQKAGL